jgi:hypothetical protein
MRFRRSYCAGTAPSAAATPRRRRFSTTTASTRSSHVAAACSTVYLGSFCEAGVKLRLSVGASTSALRLLPNRRVRTSCGPQGVVTSNMRIAATTMATFALVVRRKVWK